MEKKIYFLAYSKASGTISGSSLEDMTVIDGAEFPTAISIQLPKSELDRFERENDLVWNELYRIYNFENKNPVLLLKNCKFITRNSYNVHTYSADSWEWI